MIKSLTRAILDLITMGVDVKPNILDAVAVLAVSFTGRNNRVYQYQHKLVAARLKKDTAQSFRLANLARIFINLSWYNINDLDNNCYLSYESKFNERIRLIIINSYFCSYTSHKNNCRAK